MINKLIIIDSNAFAESKKIVNALKRKNTEVFEYDLSQGAFCTKYSSELFLKGISNFVLALAQDEAVNLTNICILNQHNDSNFYIDCVKDSDGHLDNVNESKSDLSRWDFMSGIMKPLYLMNEVETLHLLDINHFLQPHQYWDIFDYVNSNIVETSTVTSNLKVKWLSHNHPEDVIQNEMSKSVNWMHSMCTTFYSGDVKEAFDIFFNINNSSVGYISTISI